MTATREFKTCFDFCKEADDNGSVTWIILENTIRIFDYHSGNIDLCEKLNFLNRLADENKLSLRGWRIQFQMTVNKPPFWIKYYEN